MRFRFVPALLFLAALLALLPTGGTGQEQPKTQSRLKTLVGLLGKDRTSPEIECLFKDLGEKPMVDDESKYEKGGYYYSWKPKGVSLRFVSGKLATIFLYAEAAAGFKQYEGELPAKLSFGDTRAEVEEKLGKPEMSGGQGVIPYWAVYEKGVQVQYVSKDLMDQKNRIHYVGLISVSNKDK